MSPARERIKGLDREAFRWMQRNLGYWALYSARVLALGHDPTEPAPAGVAGVRAAVDAALAEVPDGA